MKQLVLAFALVGLASAFAAPSHAAVKANTACTVVVTAIKQLVTAVTRITAVCAITITR